MNDEFYRISRLPPYVFAEVNKIKAAARAKGKDVIDLGMGNPDTPTPKHIIDKLPASIRHVTIDPKPFASANSASVTGSSRMRVILATNRSITSCVEVSLVSAFIIQTP